MSAHVLLNLINKLGKSDKMRGLTSILLLFRNEFNNFNNTGAHLSLTLEWTKIAFWHENFKILSSFTQH